ncbi:hypothetical protein LTR86_004741 [Recurvomyces mirabilis]|nr:hypothetical protein LTR86_004741 [Recurvomyces mirabilis]
MKTHAYFLTVAFAITSSPGVTSHPTEPHHGDALQLMVPKDDSGASIAHSPSFSSFSFEPAYWVEFFGNSTSPNPLTFRLLDLIHQHGGRPIIRPGGITMDSMIFDPNAGDPVRETSKAGGVYRTTVGPAYYESWSNFPNGTKFVSTLNFGNNSLDIARDMAVASVTYQRDLVEYFELGNEPTNYPESRWNDSTAAYVQQWKSWTTAIDTAVNQDVAKASGAAFPVERWWASSATTDDSGLNVLPADIIPAGVDSAHQVAEYSIHSYPFSTCDPARAALATTSNILNHTGLAAYADDEIYPSAKAALDSSSKWVVGEFNSISCSGNPNVTDTFAQALWVIDSELIYATRNASSCNLHQGAALVFQSSDQVNSAASDGSPGYSTYDMFYPTNSSLRGPARVLPSFAGQLFLAEAFATNGSRVTPLAAPAGVDADHFAAYAFYDNATVSKIAIINMQPYYVNSTSDFAVKINIPVAGQSHHGWGSSSQTYVKRLTAPYVNSKNATDVKWAGQTFDGGVASGKVQQEMLTADGTVTVRGSEAVLVFLK